MAWFASLGRPIDIVAVTDRRAIPPVSAYTEELRRRGPTSGRPPSRCWAWAEVTRLELPDAGGGHEPPCAGSGDRRPGRARRRARAAAGGTTAARYPSCRSASRPDAPARSERPERPRRTVATLGLPALHTSSERSRAALTEPPVPRHRGRVAADVGGRGLLDLEAPCRSRSARGGPADGRGGAARALRPSRRRGIGAVGLTTWPQRAQIEIDRHRRRRSLARSASSPDERRQGGLTTDARPRGAGYGAVTRLSCRTAVADHGARLAVAIADRAVGRRRP